MSAPLLFTFAEAIERLGGSVSESWLRRSVAARAVPHRRLSPRVVRFSERDLEEIVELTACVPYRPVPRGVVPMPPQPQSRRRSAGR